MEEVISEVNLLGGMIKYAFDKINELSSVQMNHTIALNKAIETLNGIAECQNIMMESYSKDEKKHN